MSHGVSEPRPFASLRISATGFLSSWLQATTNLTLAWRYLHHYLPLDTQLSFQYQFYTSGNAIISIWSVAASTPLMGFSESRRVNELTLERDKIAVEQAHRINCRYKFNLKSPGWWESFLNVRISADDIGLNVALENRRYNRNQVDGVGVALGIISSYVGEGVCCKTGEKLPTTKYSFV